jgi:hypothetical protein
MLAPEPVIDPQKIIPFIGLSTPFVSLYTIAGATRNCMQAHTPCTHQVSQTSSHYYVWTTSNRWLANQSLVEAIRAEHFCLKLVSLSVSSTARFAEPSSSIRLTSLITITQFC